MSTKRPKKTSSETSADFMANKRIRDVDSISSKQLNQLQTKCFVECLETEKSLFLKKSKKKTRPPKPVDGQYWAERIETARVNSGGDLVYLIKWEGYSSSSNTWQNTRDLIGGDLFLFRDFFIRMFDSETDIEMYSENDFSDLSESLSSLVVSADPAILNRINDVVEAEDANQRQLDKTLRRMADQLKPLLEAFRRLRGSVEGKQEEWTQRVFTRFGVKELKIDERFGSLRKFIEFSRKRRQTLLDLEKWTQNTGVLADNRVDVSVPPQICESGHSVTELPLNGPPPLPKCECQDDCRRTRCVCGTALYREGRRFRSSHVVYECNQRCLCGQKCPNRRIQNGATVRLQVFRTRDRGWGLRTLDRVSYRSFVGEYRGDVLSSCETIERDSTYLFQIDAEFCGIPVFIDGKRRGNVMRFANHCCSPNMDVHLAFVGTQDVVPRVAFFANRNISAGEELTYDYGRQTLHSDADGNFVPDESDSGYASSCSRDLAEEAITCLCGSEKCRKFI